jgi:hypothetical protein
MSNIIKLTGKILFDPEDVTNKQANQSSWKKVAMVLFDGDVCEYYAWFIKKRFNLTLHKPVRGAHVTFVNDSMRDLSKNGLLDDSRVLENWQMVKKKWNGKKIEVYLNLIPDTDSLDNEDCHWWLIVPHDKRQGLQEIREELGLGRPFFGLHMTIGRAVESTSVSNFEPGVMKAKEMSVDHSKYIHNLIKNGFIQ